MPDQNYSNYEKKFYIKFNFYISKIAKIKQKNIEVLGMVKEIIPLAVRKVSYFSQDLALIKKHLYFVIKILKQEDFLPSPESIVSY